MTEDNKDKKKIAHRSDWKNEPMPQQHETFVLNRAFSDEEMKALRCGNVPQAMEDKWFWYMEGATLWAHRSWTGYCIYQIDFMQDNYHIVTVNRDPEQYTCTGIEEDMKSLNKLLDWWVQTPYDHYGEWLSETHDMMSKNLGNRIMLVGCTGAGKSTLAGRLQRITGLPLIHLDSIWWKADRTHISRDEFDEKLAEVLKGDRWIIDGDYSRTYEPRISACDTLIFLDYDKETCLQGLKDRVGRKRSDIPWIDNQVTEDRWQEVDDYFERKRPILHELIEKHKDKNILIFKSREETDKWLASLDKLECIVITQRPEMKEKAAEWFSSKWGVDTQAYLDCMNECIAGEVPYDWYLCVHEDEIVAGLGIIENDFHERKDLTPNVCAVYTEEEYRGRGIMGRLLTMAARDMYEKGFSKLYLLTDHTGYYERYDWEFLCMVLGEGETEPSRMYVHTIEDATHE